MVVARVNIDEFANRVLNIIKAKFGLKDKSEALNKFVRMFGSEFIDDVDEDYVKSILKIEEEHFKNHKNRKMSLTELDDICEAN